MRKTRSVDAPLASTCFIIFIIGIIGTLCALNSLSCVHSVSGALVDLSDAVKGIVDKDQIVHKIGNLQPSMRRQVFVLATLAGVLGIVVLVQSYLWCRGGAGKRRMQMNFRAEKTMLGRMADGMLCLCLNRRAYVVLLVVGVLAVAALTAVGLAGSRVCILDLARNAFRLPDALAVQQFLAKQAAVWMDMESALQFILITMQGFIVISWLFCMLRVSAFFRVEKSRISR